MVRRLLVGVILLCQCWSVSFAWRCAEANVGGGIMAQLQSQSYARSVEIERNGKRLNVLEYNGDGGPELHAGVHFPCGLPSTFSLTFTLRLNRTNTRRWKYLFALYNRRTESALFRLALSPRRGGRLQVESDRWKNIYRGRHQWPKFNVNGLFDGRWHTVTLKIDSDGVVVWLDCSREPAQRRTLPVLLAVPPERIGDLVVLVGQKHPRDKWMTKAFRGQLESLRFYSDPNEAFASTCISDIQPSAHLQRPSQGAPTLQNGRVTVTTHAPSECKRHIRGAMWFDTIVGRLKICDGSRWRHSSPAGDCSLRYFADFEKFDFRDIVDFEPFRWPGDSGEKYGGDHYAVASRIVHSTEGVVLKQRSNERPSLQCTTSIIYRWSRKGGWHPYDILQSLDGENEICNSKFTQFFTIGGARFLAVLDIGRQPALQKSTIVIYRLYNECSTARFCGMGLVQKLNVYAYQYYGEQFDVFSIGARTFLAAANFRTPAGCRQTGRFWCFEPNTQSTIYEWSKQREKFVVFDDSIATFGANKIKHFTSADGTEHFLAVANMLNGSREETQPGRSSLYRWTGNAFRFVHSVPTEAAVAIETFAIAGRSYVNIVNSMRVVRKDTPHGPKDLVKPDLTADLLKLEKTYEGWRLKRSQQLEMFNGVSARFFRICNRDYLALANRFDQYRSRAVYGAMVLEWQGISGFRKTSVISASDVNDIEHVEINGQHYILLARLGQADSQSLKVVTTNCGCS